MVVCHKSVSYSYCESLSSPCRGAGTGGLGLAMEGPSEAKMSCTDNKDGSCSVEYIPYEPGTYNLNITYGGQPITGTEYCFSSSSKKYNCEKNILLKCTHPLLLSRGLKYRFPRACSEQEVRSLCPSATQWTVPR